MSKKFKKSQNFNNKSSNLDQDKSNDKTLKPAPVENQDEADKVQSK